MIIEKNRVVSINYTLTSREGKIIEAVEGGETLDYLHGAGNIFPALEAVLEGKKKGDNLKVSIPPAEAYGDYDEDLILEIEKSRFEEDDKLEVGMEFGGQGPDGRYRVFTIIDVEGDKVKVNGNHTLAGQTLNFDVKIADVREATPEEIAHGHLHGEEGCGGGCCGCGDEKEESDCGGGCCGCH